MKVADDLMAISFRSDFFIVSGGLLLALGMLAMLIGVIRSVAYQEIMTIIIFPGFLGFMIGAACMLIGYVLKRKFFKMIVA